MTEQEHQSQETKKAEVIDLGEGMLTIKEDFVPNGQVPRMTNQELLIAIQNAFFAEDEAKLNQLNKQLKAQNIQPAAVQAPEDLQAPSQQKEKKSVKFAEEQSQEDEDQVPKRPMSKFKQERLKMKK